MFQDPARSSCPFYEPDPRKCYPIDNQIAVAGSTYEIQCPLAKRPIDGATYRWYVEDWSTGHVRLLQLAEGGKMEALNSKKDTIWVRNVSKSDARIYICERHVGRIRQGWKVKLHVDGESINMLRCWSDIVKLKA